MAGEFGISADEVMGLLRQMDVPVRSHLSPLTDDQVARVRARWEREKRVRAERQAAPPAPARRRRGAATATVTAEPAPTAADASDAAGQFRRRRKAADVAAAAAEVAAEQAAADAVALQAAEAAAAERAEAERVEAERQEMERARAAAQAAAAAAAQAEAQAREQETPEEQHATPESTSTEPQRAAPVRPAGGPLPPAAGADRPRPRPITPGAPRPRPVTAGSPFPPRPVASASPGGFGGATRTPERRPGPGAGAPQAGAGVGAGGANRNARKKGKRGAVDQDAVDANIAKTMASMRGAPARGGRIDRRGMREEAEAMRAAEVEREKKLVRVNEFITVSELAQILKVSPTEIVGFAFKNLGLMITVNQRLDFDQVQLPGGKMITFLDTPGHEAFTAMRARGAQVTDEVILVVAADDAVMPQTIEAISHAKNAGVPMIVAINKIDLPQANPMKVKQDLLQHGVVLEEFGGTTLSTEISAKKGTNVGELLEQVLLQAELLDLKSNPNKRATGTVVEAQLDPGKGPVATVLVQSGTLRVGDDFIVGMYSGRVRAMLDERGKTVKAAGPAIPVQVLGMTGVPMAGDQMLVVEDATAAREVAQRRERLDREAKSRRSTRGVTLEDFMAQSASGDVRALRILIKADQGGPAEALADALSRLGTTEVKVEVVHRGVGAITESDILLARASGAIIIGFHVRPDNNARAAAERENVDIKLYRIIYEAVADVRAALEGMLRPEEREVVLGEAEVLETFKVPKIGVIAGCAVRTGLIRRDARVRIIRDAIEVYEGNIASLRRFKDDVKEVREGFECGIGIENFNDLKVGDRIECYRTEEVARTLESAPQG